MEVIAETYDGRFHIALYENKGPVISQADGCVTGEHFWYLWVVIEHNVVGNIYRSAFYNGPQELDDYEGYMNAYAEYGRCKGYVQALRMFYESDVHRKIKER